MFRRSHLVPLAVLLLLVACGGNEGAAPSPTTAPPAGEPTAAAGGNADGDACALLTEAEVSDATGLGVTDVTSEAAAGESTRCSWVLDDDPDIPSQVTIVLYTKNGVSYYEAQKPGTQYAPDDAETVSGVGDGAHINSAAGAPTLTVLVGDVSFFVQYVPGTEDPSADRGDSVVRTLAPLAAQRL